MNTRNLEQLASMLGVDEVRVGNRHAGWIIALRLDTQWLSTEILMQDLVGVRKQEEAIGKVVASLANVLKAGKRADLDKLGGVTRPPHPPMEGRNFVQDCMCVDCLERQTEAELRRPINRFEAVAAEMKKL